MRNEFDKDNKVEQVLSIILFSRIDVEDGCSVFFSGAKNMRHAIKFCETNQNHGFRTLLHTPMFRELTDIPLFGNASSFTPEEALDISALASLKFALSARGNVQVFSSKISESSTFYTVELPALLFLNDNVQTINGADKMLWQDFVRNARFPQTEILPSEMFNLSGKVYSQNFSNDYGGPGM